jgi:iron(III) transport system ATP-binding protein
MTSLRLENITKAFGSTYALRDIGLEIGSGELFFLLGPSGCGKSTLLRLIAGLHEPTAGRLFFNDDDVTALPTQRRNAVMCFQSYALWPHMSVRENIRFGLAVRGLSRQEQTQRIDEVLALVQMRELADRKPNQLSGGQQQRVALARALAVRPACLLLDEPLSNLDAQLRQEMRSEIRRICKSAGFTTVYVTHDQKEALSMADRIGILNDGRLVQVGTPGELYRRPGTSFVANFIGQTNLMRGRIISRQGNLARVRTTAGEILARCNGDMPADAVVSIRPEHIRIASGSIVRDDVNRLSGHAVENTFLGETSEHVIQVASERLRMICAPPLLDAPLELCVEFSAEDVVLLPE